MNKNYPHEIVPENELTPAAKREYTPLTEAEMELLAPMSREERSTWLRVNRTAGVDQLRDLRQLYDALEARR